MLATRCSRCAFRLSTRWRICARRWARRSIDVRRGMGSDRRIGSSVPVSRRRLRRLVLSQRCAGADPQRRRASTSISTLLRATDEVNVRQKRSLAERVKQHFGADLHGRTLAVWGMAFKPRTDDMREAPSLVVIEELLAAGASVRAHDPEALENARRMFGDRISYHQNNYEALTARRRADHPDRVERVPPSQLPAHPHHAEVTGHLRRTQSLRSGPDESAGVSVTTRLAGGRLGAPSQGELDANSGHRRRRLYRLAYGRRSGGGAGSHRSLHHRRSLGGQARSGESARAISPDRYTRRGGCAAALSSARRPEVIVHLAAQMDVRRSVADPSFDAQVNLVGFLNLMESGASMRGSRRVIFSSTGGAIYGEQESFPATKTIRCAQSVPTASPNWRPKNTCFSTRRNMESITLRCAMQMSMVRVRTRMARPA